MTHCFSNESIKNIIFRKLVKTIDVEHCSVQTVSLIFENIDSIFQVEEVWMNFMWPLC